MNLFCCVRCLSYPNMKKSVVPGLKVASSSPNYVYDSCETLFKRKQQFCLFHWKQVLAAWQNQKAFPPLQLHVSLFIFRPVFSNRNIFSLISFFPLCLESVCALYWYVPSSLFTLSVLCSSLSNLFNNICILSLLSVFNLYFIATMTLFCYLLFIYT